MRLIGKKAVVTGGSSGIGLESTRLFISEGADVLIIVRNQERLDAAVAYLGPQASGIVGDIAQSAALAVATKDAGERLGGIDILFANAGVSETFAETSEMAFDSAMRRFESSRPSQSLTY